MLMLVTYDVATTTPEGRRRLRRVARVCLNYGQRVQLSVFECSVGEKQLVQPRHDLLKEINPHEDSLRLYNLGEIRLHVSSTMVNGPRWTSTMH